MYAKKVRIFAKDFGKLMYVLYLAVNDEIRSKGYGTLILNHLKEMGGNREITLNIEPLYENADNYEQRIKRMKFYEKKVSRCRKYL